MLNTAAIGARLQKMERAIVKNFPDAKITHTNSVAGTIAEFTTKAGKKIELAYGDLKGIGKRIVKNSDGDILTIMKKEPYATGGLEGLTAITKDAKGKVLNAVADFGDETSRYITTDKMRGAAYQFLK